MKEVKGKVVKIIKVISKSLENDGKIFKHKYISGVTFKIDEGGYAHIPFNMGDVPPEKIGQVCTLIMWSCEFGGLNYGFVKRDTK